ncbi:MAG TPA: radical SAM protein [Gemmatimonadales bacterium]|nr:radical SAM protein [Gemmatimonadales bacterium]
MQNKTGWRKSEKGERLQLEFSTALPPVRHTALPILDTRAARGSTFHKVPVKTVLNSPATTGMGFWSLNPYVGCEFGCSYCYARETHRWVSERAEGREGGRAGKSGIVEEEAEETLPPSRLPALPPAEAFEHRIFVKADAADVLRRTLDPVKLAGASLVIGTATDPYQPAERKFKLTRSILEALLGWRGLSLGLITKSPLVTRDLDVLQRLSERHEVSVNISLASLNAPLLRRLERRSPAPHARIRALKTLIDGGIHTGLLIAPILPGITDDRAGLATLMRAAKDAGARYAVGQPLRLGPAIVPQFMPVLEQEFPELVERYRQHYGHGNYVSAEYQKALMHRLHQLQEEFGFPVAESRRRREQLEGRQPRWMKEEWQATLPGLQ